MAHYGTGPKKVFRKSVPGVDVDPVLWGTRSEVILLQRFVGWFSALQVGWAKGSY
jgi:hypothetical protein